MPSIKLSFEVDEADWNTIQTELAQRQARLRHPEGGVVVPDGESDTAGALIAEVIRDLDEYRSQQDHYEACREQLRRAHDWLDHAWHKAAEDVTDMSRIDLVMEINALT